jgi:predicted dehydrogenase
MAHYLVGPIEAVCGDMRIFVPERPGAGGTSYERVTADDASLALLRFANGAMGTLEASRQATGHLNTLRFEIDGTSGAIAFDLEQLNELEFFDRSDPPHLRGWRTINVTARVHPYMAARWSAGRIVGYDVIFVHQVVEWLLHGHRRFGQVSNDSLHKFHGTCSSSLIARQSRSLQVDLLNRKL